MNTQLHDMGCPRAHPEFEVGCEGCTCTVLTQEELDSNVTMQGKTEQNK